MLSEKLSANLRDVGLLVLRLGAGGIMAGAHGFGKLTSFSEKASQWADPIGLGPEISLALAIFAEFFCSILLILGLGTRFAAIPLIVTMLVAAVIVHGADPFSDKEKALLFLVPFVTLLLAGPGRFSLDAVIAKKFRKKK